MERAAWGDMFVIVEGGKPQVTWSVGVEVERCGTARVGRKGGALVRYQSTTAQRGPRMLDVIASRLVEEYTISCINC